MRNAILYRIIPWAIILLPFLILGVFYSSLPVEIMMFRGLDAASAEYAPRSLFTVFRVPLIEVVCGLAIEIVRGKPTDIPAQKSYFLMWTILLYTVAAKTLLQTLELISPRDTADIYFYLTAGTVVVGIIAALIVGRKILLNFRGGDWKLGTSSKAALFGLLVSYLFLAFVPPF